MKLLKRPILLLLIFFLGMAQAHSEDSQQYVARLNFKSTTVISNQFVTQVITTPHLLKEVASITGYTNGVSDLELVFDPNELLLYVASKETGEFVSYVGYLSLGRYCSIEKDNSDGSTVTISRIDGTFNSIYWDPTAEEYTDIYLGNAFGRMVTTEDSEGHELNFKMQLEIHGANYMEDTSLEGDLVEGTITTIRKFTPTSPPLVF